MKNRRRSNETHTAGQLKDLEKGLGSLVVPWLPNLVRRR